MRRNIAERKKKRRDNIKKAGHVFIWLAEIAIIMFFAVMLVFFMGRTVTLTGNSMSPTLGSGSKVLLNRVSYVFSSPKRGDIVAFKPNGNQKAHSVVKRVIAVPGDKIQIQNGSVYLNGELQQEEYPAMDYSGVAEEEITLERDEYFVLGDNRNNSEDSRHADMGNVKKDHIEGKAWFIISPRNQFGFLK